MREFSSLEDAERWALNHDGGRGIKVVVRRKVYLLEVREPADDLRRHLAQQEELAQIWKVLGVLVGIAWALTILWMVCP